MEEELKKIKAVSGYFITTAYHIRAAFKEIRNKEDLTQEFKKEKNHI